MPDALLLTLLPSFLRPPPPLPGFPFRPPPLADTPRCNSAPSVASAETGFRIPLTNTPGFVLAALGLCASLCCPGVAFSVELTDLDWGSWEGSLPGSSSLGGEGKSSPRRLHLSILASAGIQELTGGKNSINFFGVGDFSSPSACGGLAHSGPPKWPTLSPPPTFCLCYLRHCWS